MSPSTWWWIATALTVAAELASGTFYLLMVAGGLAAGAVSAHLGAPLAGQLLAAALVGGGAVALWTRQRQRRPAPPPAASDPDQHLDLGQPVHVSHWRGDGTARVHYRGTEWTARWQATDAAPLPPGPGTFTIRALRGNQLVVGP